MKYTKLWRAVLIVLLSLSIWGCARRVKEETQVVNTGTVQQAALEEDETDSIEDLTETETEVFEPASEMMTEEMDFRSIREVLDEDTLSWAESFNADNIEKMVYTILGETKTEYEVADAEKIVPFYVAIMDLTVGGLADTFIQDAGDTYDFYIKDGRVIRFEFNMGCFVSDGKIYETDNSDRLWELTGELIPPEDL